MAFDDEICRVAAKNLPIRASIIHGKVLTRTLLLYLYVRARRRQSGQPYDN